MKYISISYFIICASATVGAYLCPKAAIAQHDTTRVLDEIKVEAYRYNRSLVEVPVSAALVDQQLINRFNNTSLLPAVNTVPGVRMEERSPGSYRFSVRGSLVRSPFGVRNVKVYWNGLPFTDGGGNTYLNLIDVSAIGSLEIIKGPGGSLYGAGTGGVMLFKSPRVDETSLSVSLMGGSYGLQRYQVGGRIILGNTKGSINYSRQQSDGYREQTGLRRDAVNMDWVLPLGNRTFLSATAFYTDIEYGTPGALTLSEFEQDPRKARPAAGPNRGAIEQDAHVQNRTIYGGVSMDHDWSDSWSTRVGVFASYSDFSNFAIRNFERRLETNAGARVENQYSFGSTKHHRFTFGGEFQLFESPLNVYQNNFGERGNQTIDDRLSSWQNMLFTQAEFELPHRYFITIATSINLPQYKFERNFPGTDVQRRGFKTIVSPRVALLKRLSENVTFFGSIARGFSPPSLAEVRPSTEAFNRDLEAEYGVNFEAGMRGSWRKISYDVTVYDFNLRNTIVLQRVSDGAEYFVNAGRTDQKGIEATVSWKPASIFTLWGSYSYNHYRFDDYVKDGNDYSGRKLTGVPPTVFTFGADLRSERGLYVNLTTTYNDHIPLNDANDEYAPEFIIMNIRLGYDGKLSSKVSYDLFAGINNMFDATYSLGNDLNAIGRRYYNAAAGRNFFAGVVFKNVFANAK